MSIYIASYCYFISFLLLFIAYRLYYLVERNKEHSSLHVNISSTPDPHIQSFGLRHSKVFSTEEHRNYEKKTTKLRED